MPGVSAKRVLTAMAASGTWRRSEFAGGTPAPQIPARSAGTALATCGSFFSSWRTAMSTLSSPPQVVRPGRTRTGVGRVVALVAVVVLLAPDAALSQRTPPAGAPVGTGTARLRNAPQETPTPKTPTPQPPTPAPPSADTLFDPAELHVIQITMKTGGLAGADGELHPQHLLPRRPAVEGPTGDDGRRPVARVRQPQQGQARPADRLQPLHARPAVPRLEVRRVGRRRAGSVDAAVSAGLHVLCADGRPSFARGAREGCTSTATTWACTSWSRQSTR